MLLVAHPKTNPKMPAVSRAVRRGTSDGHLWPITPEAVAEVGRAVGYRAPPSSLDTFTGDLLASLCEAPDGELCLQFHQCRL